VSARRLPAPEAGKPWTRSPVYRTQCVTARVFMRLMGLQGDVSKGPDPRHYFRVVPAYRCDTSRALRKATADLIRLARRHDSLYGAVLEAGIPHDHHETDLYLPATRGARALLACFPLNDKNAEPFTSAVDGSPWLDVPFAYLPAWRARQ
jgi:hypothetical protein